MLLSAQITILKEKTTTTAREPSSFVFQAILVLRGLALTNDEVIVVNDTYADERFNKKVTRKLRIKLDHLLSVPIHNEEGKVIGKKNVLV